MAHGSDTYTFICGDDDYLVGERAKAVFAKMSEGLSDDFSREIVEGNAQNADEVMAAVGRFLSAVQTVSLFGEKKAVWFRGLNFLGTTRTGESKAAKEEVLRLVEALRGIDFSAVNVLISATGVDQRKKEFKELKSGGNFEQLSGDPEQARHVLEAAAKDCGAAFAPGAAAYLHEALQGNLRLGIEETRKLSLYLCDEKNARITEDLIDEMVPQFGESEFFEPLRPFFEGDLPKTLAALTRYFFTRKDARGLLSALQNRTRTLIQLRALMDSGKLRLSGNWVDRDSYDNARARYGDLFDAGDKAGVFAQNPRALGFLAKEAARFKLRKLIDFQDEFLKAFQGILSRPNEQDAVLRETAARCLGAAEN